MAKTPGGKNFERTKDYQNSPVFEMKEKKLIYSLQQSLFEVQNDWPAKGLRARLGSFFHVVDKGIHGGKIKDTKLILNEGGLNIVTPDVVDFEKEEVRDSKGVSCGREVKLFDWQVPKYAMLQKSSFFNLPRISYDIFRHGIRRLESELLGESEEVLLGRLSSEVMYSISVPFSIIFELWKKGNSRQDIQRHETYTRFNSSMINALLLDPEEAMESFGLSREDYSFERRKFPEGATMDGHEINSFPVLIIRDSNHSEFVRNFRERYAEFTYKS